MIPILMYHEVGDQKTSFSSFVTKVQFETQMRYLSENGFRTILLDELCEYNSGLKKINSDLKPIMITFDDGHIGNYDFAFPILKKYNLAAVFFISVNMIRNKKNMVSWKQINEMSEAGMSIQSHALTHHPLTTKTNDQISYELTESRKLIEYNVGKKVEFLSLPHGDFNKRILSLVKKAQYKAVFTSEPEYFYEAKKLFFIGRIEIRRTYSHKYFESIVENECKYFNLIICAHKIKFFIRSGIGINNFRRLYRLINKLKLTE